MTKDYWKVTTIFISIVTILLFTLLLSQNSITKEYSSLIEKHNNLIIKHNTLIDLYNETINAIDDAKLWYLDNCFNYFCKTQNCLNEKYSRWAYNTICTEIIFGENLTT